MHPKVFGPIRLSVVEVLAVGLELVAADSKVVVEEGTMELAYAFVSEPVLGLGDLIGTVTGSSLQREGSGYF